MIPKFDDSSLDFLEELCLKYVKLGVRQPAFLQALQKARALYVLRYFCGLKKPNQMTITFHTTDRLFCTMAIIKTLDVIANTLFLLRLFLRDD